MTIILKGVNAEIFDYENQGQLFIQNSPDFTIIVSQPNNITVDRSIPVFEAVMCYYYIDKTLTYAKSLESFSGVLRFDPHYPDGLESSDYNYYGSYGLIRLADGLDNSDKPNFRPNVDHGEDAMEILHETGHFIQHSLAGIGDGDLYALGYDGINEGFADYWACSEVNALKQYKDYEEGFYKIFRWADWNDGSNPDYYDFPKSTWRTANTNYPYPDPDIVGHYLGTILSTVLMKIYIDIGKTRTDNIVLKGIKAAKYTADKQYKLANDIYQAAVNENYENWELCIIWNHFNRTYNVGATRFTGTNPNVGTDLFMRDNVDDVGIEPNPTAEVMYLSEDIWVRPTDDDKPYHDNPEYRSGAANKNNYIYVKVRSRGCIPVSNAFLHVYWSKASTGLAWDINWLYSEDQINHKQISGEILIGGQPIDLAPLNIKCGEEKIVKIPWIPPNPDDFNDNGKHHYCLLARIVSTNSTPDDPMHCTEVSDVNANTKCNNNIVWKNVTVISVPGYTTDTATVYVRDVLNNVSGSSCLQITDVIMSHYSNALANASISINLRDSLKTLWISGGSHGSGFSYNSETGLFNITSFPVTFCNVNLTYMNEYLLDIFVRGNGDPKPFAFDLKHYKTSPTGTLVGGERFVFPGTGDAALPRSASKKNTDILKLLTVSPNPCHEELFIEFDNMVPEFNVKIYDSFSKLLLETHVTGLNHNIYTLDMNQITSSGLLIVQLNFGKNQRALKIIKL